MSLVASRGRVTQHLPALGTGSASAPGKPALRGYSHAVAAAASVGGGTHLLRVANGDALQHVALGVFGVSTVLLFATSALYHLGRWAPRRHAVLRRLDYAMIFGGIAGAYTPMGVGLLTGWWRVALPAAIWVLSLCGAATVVARPALPRPVRVALYSTLVGIAVGTSSPIMLGRVAPADLFLLGISVALAGAGVLVYARRRPVLWPGVFGFHELFHLFVIATIGVFYLFLVQQVVAVRLP